MKANSYDSEFNGARAVVTGGAHGIGRAVVRRLADGGASVVTADIKAPPEIGTTEFFVEADISSATGVADIARFSLEKWGAVDHVVHVVGGSPAVPEGLLGIDDAAWLEAFNLNVFGAVRLDRALVPSMIEQGRGSIVHVTSIARRQPMVPTMAYSAAKAALAAYSKAAAKQLAPLGVRVNAVAPGFIETEGARGLVQDVSLSTGLALDEAGLCSWKPSARRRWVGRAGQRRLLN